MNIFDKHSEKRSEGSQGDRGINATILFLSRLCRESPLTPWRTRTLEAMGGDGIFSSPPTASRRVRGLGQRPKVWIVNGRIVSVEPSSEGNAQPEAPLGYQSRLEALGVRYQPFV